MTREQAISTIEALYPADADHDDCREIGKQLLELARMEAKGWRQETDAILIRYAQLCMDKERQLQARHEREQRARERGY